MSDKCLPCYATIFTCLTRCKNENVTRKKKICYVKFYELFTNTEIPSSHCFSHVVDTNYSCIRCQKNLHICSLCCASCSLAVVLTCGTRGNCGFESGLQQFTVKFSLSLFSFFCSSFKIINLCNYYYSVNSIALISIKWCYYCIKLAHKSIIKTCFHKNVCYIYTQAFVLLMFHEKGSLCTKREEPQSSSCCSLVMLIWEKWV